MVAVSATKIDLPVVPYSSASDLTVISESNSGDQHQNEDNAATQGINQILLLSDYAHSKQHPFAALNELNQKAILQRLVYHDLGCQDQYWKAQIGISCKVLGMTLLCFEGRGGSKQDAKRHAAECALERLMRRSPCDLDTQRLLGDTSPSDSREHIQLAEGYNGMFTRKQNQAFLLAQKHLELIKKLSLPAQMVSGLDTILLAIDLEWHETGSHELLEIGLSLALRSHCFQAMPRISTYHLTVEEHYHIRNGTFVPDHKDHFNFGSSELIAYEKLGHRVREILGLYSSGCHEIMLVGHSIHHDLVLFERLGMSDIINHIATNVCDVALAYQAQQQEKQTTKLSKILDHYNVPYRNLHNAANDAYYTLIACIKLGMAEWSHHYEGS